MARADMALHPEDILLVLKDILLAIKDIHLPPEDILLAGADTLLALEDILLPAEDILLAAEDRAVGKRNTKRESGSSRVATTGWWKFGHWKVKRRGGDRNVGKSVAAMRLLALPNGAARRAGLGQGRIHTRTNSTRPAAAAPTTCRAAAWHRAARGQ